MTFPRFKRQVLEELNADLALAVLIDERYDYLNPFWQHAKYRWTAPLSQDYSHAFDSAQRWLCHKYHVPAPDWRSLLRIDGTWLGGVRFPDPEPSASVIPPFCRWLLLRGLQQDNLLDRYDRFVITRSDFVWLCPHPPLSILDPRGIWIPDGEDYDGVNDRHLVVSRDDVVNCLNQLEAVLLESTELHEEMKHNSYWNCEMFLKHHLGRKDLLHKVKRFPYVMYLARYKRDDSPTWSRGRYDAASDHFVKYDPEFDLASGFAEIITSRADWEKGDWKQVDASVFVPRPVSIRSQLFDGWYQIVWALRRPGRLGRLLRFCLRIVRRTETAD